MTEKSAHTAGPWRLTIGRMHPDAPAFGFGVYPEKDMPNLPTGIKQHSIASGNLYEHGAYEAFYKPAEIEANARLIAAAPDLLAFAVAHDAYMLDAGYSGPDDTALHPKAAANWRVCRATLSRAKDQP
jgi:hypothetical protein